MSDIALITDSSACLPEYIVNKYGIKILPMEFIYKGETYRDEIDITLSVFNEILSNVEELPITSTPSPGTYLEAFKEMAKNFGSILVVTPSKSYTHAFTSAKTALTMVKGKIPKTTVVILDSGTAAGAQGLVVLAAAKAVAAGENIFEVLEATRRIIPKVYLITFFDNLSYFSKSRLVPQNVVWTNPYLKTRPFFELCPFGGGLKLLCQVGTRPKAIERLIQLVIERADGKPVNCIIMHAHVLNEAEQLKSQIASVLNCVEICVKDFTPVIGVRSGPGLLAVAFHTIDGEVLDLTNYQN